MTVSFSRIVDLTHPIAPGIPVWPGDPEVRLERIAGIESDGWLLNALTIGEHSGTHIGTSAHFRGDGISVDRLPPASLVRAAVAIDARGWMLEGNEFRLDTSHIEEWEAGNGMIPEGAVVLLNTGWSRKWPDPIRYMGTPHAPSATESSPGFGLESAIFLAEQRGVAALGIDTHGIDAGTDTELSVNGFWLRGERFHLENLTNLELLPPTGITLFIGPLAVTGGSGAPARVLALVE